MNFGENTQGSINAANDVDCFTLDVDPDHVVKVTMTPPSGIDFDLRVYASSGIEQGSSILGPGLVDEVALPTELAQALCARVEPVEAFGNQTGNYTIRATHETDDAGVSSRATPVELGTINSAIQFPGDSDYFAVEIEANKVLTIVLNTQGVDYDMVLYDSNDVQIEVSGDPGANEQITRVINTAGTYYIEVRGFEQNVGDYSMTISVADDN